MSEIKTKINTKTKEFKNKSKEFKNKSKEKLIDWKKWFDLKRYAKRYIIIERDGKVFEVKRDIYLKDDRVITMNNVVKVLVTKRGKRKNMRVLSESGDYVIVYLDNIKYVYIKTIEGIVR